MKRICIRTHIPYIHTYIRKYGQTSRHTDKRTCKRAYILYMHTYYIAFSIVLMLFVILVIIVNVAISSSSPAA